MRDQNGKFCKSNGITIPLSSLKTIISLITAILILLPWFMIISINDMINRSYEVIENLLFNFEKKNNVTLGNGSENFEKSQWTYK